MDRNCQNRTQSGRLYGGIAIDLQIGALIAMTIEIAGAATTAKIRSTLVILLGYFLPEFCAV
jgi:hypothetical protein